MTLADVLERFPGESLKAYKTRIGEARKRLNRELARENRLYRHARRVYDEIDRSPDSDSSDIERPQF